MKNPATVAVVLLPLLLISHSIFASAASGGQSGGSVFPSGGGSSSSGGSGSGSGSGSWSGGGSDSWSGGGSGEELGLRGSLVLIAAFVVFVAVLYYCGGVKTSVVKLQVGLVGKAPSVQKDLNRLTATTDMSTALGLSHLLTGELVVNWLTIFED